MTTLVTGAGLIGASFGKLALQRGEKLVFVDPEPRSDFLRFKLGDEGYVALRQDVRDLPALIDAVDKHQVETIVHTAGLIGSRVQQSLSLAFDINLGGTRNVAEAARLTGVRRIVHISTFGVYDRRRPAAGPIAEDFPRGGDRGYGNYKAAKELILEAYANAFGFELTLLRPANVFGAGHFWSGSSGGRKMQALIQAGLDGKSVRIPAEEAFDNEYVYAPDVGKAVDLAATTSTTSEGIFNIGNGYVTSFPALVEAVRSVFPNLDVEVAAGSPAGSKLQPMDISRAQQVLGWRPGFTLEAALKDFAGELKAARGLMHGFDH